MLTIQQQQKWKLMLLLMVLTLTVRRLFILWQVMGEVVMSLILFGL